MIEISMVLIWAVLVTRRGQTAGSDLVNVLILMIDSVYTSVFTFENWATHFSILMYLQFYVLLFYFSKN